MCPCVWAGDCGCDCGYFAHLPLSSLEIDQQGEAGTYDQRLEDNSPGRKQNICCQGDRDTNICFVTTPVTHCVIFDKSHSLSVMQRSTLI